MMQQLPRVIYHSCDRFAMEKIIEHGFNPGGWPQRTGRAHNFFIALHPWDDAVGGKKLAGTRAGKQYYLAFDTELVVQSGCRLFRTDEAIISPDCVSNENLICSYDSVNREFTWINRPYELTRVGYNAKMKEHREKNTPKSEALSMSPYANARASLKTYLESGTIPNCNQLSVSILIVFYISIIFIVGYTCIFGQADKPTYFLQSEMTSRGSHWRFTLPVISAGSKMDDIPIYWLTFFVVCFLYAPVIHDCWPKKTVVARDISEFVTDCPFFSCW